MAEPVSSKPSRLWRMIFVISLALNLAVVGLVVGAVASGRLGDGPPRAFDLGLGPVARALDPQERRAIGMALRRDAGLRRGEMRAQTALMIASLRQDPFNPDALRDVIAEQRARLGDIQNAAQEAFINQITAMSPERRAAFADVLEQELSRPPRERRSGG